jgi:hypothetical protein
MLQSYPSCLHDSNRMAGSDLPQVEVSGAVSRRNEASAFVLLPEGELAAHHTCTNRRVTVTLLVT